ncbi:hypothetical protein HYG87_02025 [Methanobacterium alkalithermotolerans]|uniref:Uncharacterized protein n=1 Tax=Methanobacterium alkalithermotolerans TaxID=2731220 RepID=A0A8T8K6F2_9EURY|nr:hypothetical protein [Methanobacterium alkalithermotolerans]QUH22630.1 hypothetical protein HYG87_02025 [Methanobacterium alkalithermotolerans]
MTTKFDTSCGFIEYPDSSNDFHLSENKCLMDYQDNPETIKIIDTAFKNIISEKYSENHIFKEETTMFRFDTKSLNKISEFIKNVEISYEHLIPSLTIGISFLTAEHTYQKIYYLLKEKEPNLRSKRKIISVNDLFRISNPDPELIEKIASMPSNNSYKVKLKVKSRKKGKASVYRSETLVDE